MDHLIACSDAAASFLGLFDLSIAPPLLYYSYIPIAVISLFFGFFVFSQDRRSLLARIFLWIAILFPAFLLNEIVQWVAVHANVVYFSWSIAPLFQAAIWALAVYFVFVFVNNRDMAFGEKITLILAALPVAILMPTTLNVQFFDLNNCEAVSGPLWNYLYAMQAVALIGIITISLRRYFSKSVDPKFKRQILILTTGMFLFLSLFAASNIFGEITKLYEVNLVGPIGMAAFLGLLSFLIVRFKTFNIKLIGAQALVFAIICLVGSEFFFVTSFTNQALVLATFVLVAIGGWLLVKNVKREVEQREKIEKVARDLDIKNTRLLEVDRQKTEFVSFATHQLRSPLTAIKGNTSLILEGDLGQISDPLRNTVQTVYSSVKTMINVVESYLNISRIELGTMKYDLRDIDFKDLVEEVAEEQKATIEAKGLKSSLSLDASQTYSIKADPDKLKQVLMNTVDNSIKYTPQGSLALSLEKGTGKAGTANAGKRVIRFVVSDTGVGIRPDVMPKLFQKFSRAPNASEANIHGTGLGLYIAREIVSAHGGSIWAESAGEGKGSQFYVEVPEAK